MGSLGLSVAYSDVLAGLSHALDLTEGQRRGHAVRSCLIGLRVADAIGLESTLRESLVHALLMKDLGCSSNAARFAALFGADERSVKANLKVVDWPLRLEGFRFVVRNVAPGAFWLTRVWRTLGALVGGARGAREVVITRCERGADIARMLGFSADTSDAIRALDEHWNGDGQPYKLAGEAIPRLARILNLAQTAEVFLATEGLDAMFAMARGRRGRWFEPALVDALGSTAHDQVFWASLRTTDPRVLLRRLDVGSSARVCDEAQLDLTALAFAQVIDAKSPWTYRHSTSVADIASQIGQRLGFDDGLQRALYRASLLHDLGKLGVSSLILDKPGKLTDDEFRSMRQHPIETAAILDATVCFRPLVDLASAHHERLDGHGYHRGLKERDLTLPQRVLTTADVCDALLASRPYRDGLDPERVLDVMGRDVGGGIDRACLDVLHEILRSSPTISTPGLPAARLVESLADDYRQAA